MAVAASAALADAPAEGGAPEGGAPAGGPEGGAPAGGPMSAVPTTPPYSGEDDVARVDENGDTVYYSMRRNWVGEAPVIADSDIAETIDADVVVLGLNYSGSQCFRMACEKGLTVVGVDTQAKDGFNSYGGQLGHFNSQWQREVLGVETEFDPWDFIDSYQLQSAGRAQPDLIKNFAKRNGELVDWMMELQPDLAAVTGNNTLQLDREYNYKKGYFWTYPAVINLGSGAFETSGAFCTASVDKGIEASPNSQALYNTAAVVLVKQDGKVTGAIVQDNETGAYKQINAKLGVVLAMGDFSANSDMYNALCTEVQECNPLHAARGLGPRRVRHQDGHLGRRRDGDRSPCRYGRRHERPAHGLLRRCGWLLDQQVRQALLQRGLRRAVRRRLPERPPAYRFRYHPGVGRGPLARVRREPGPGPLQLR